MPTPYTKAPLPGFGATLMTFYTSVASSPSDPYSHPQILDALRQLSVFLQDAFE